MGVRGREGLTVIESDKNVRVARMAAEVFIFV